MIVHVTENTQIALLPQYVEPEELIDVPVPDREGRRRILEIHAKGMPLGGDVDPGALAEATEAVEQPEAAS